MPGCRSCSEDKTPVREPQTVAIEADLALGEDSLGFRADAKRSL